MSWLALKVDIFHEATIFREQTSGSPELPSAFVRGCRIFWPVVRPVAPLQQRSWAHSHVSRVTPRSPGRGWCCHRTGPGPRPPSPSPPSLRCSQSQLRSQDYWIWRFDRSILIWKCHSLPRDKGWYDQTRKDWYWCHNFYCSVAILISIYYPPPLIIVYVSFSDCAVGLVWLDSNDNHRWITAEYLPWWGEHSDGHSMMWCW